MLADLTILIAFYVTFRVLSEFASWQEGRTGWGFRVGQACLSVLGVMLMVFAAAAIWNAVHSAAQMPRVP